MQSKSQKAEISDAGGAPVVSVPSSVGAALYARANDARRSGDHAGYAALVNELIAYNSAAAREVQP